MKKVILASDSIGWRFYPPKPRKWQKLPQLAGYGPTATRILKKNLMEVFKISFNTPEWHWDRSSRTLLSNLERWLIAPQFDVVHFNCGLHDLAIDYQEGKTDVRVSLKDYESNLTEIVKRLRDETQSILIWASNTPVVDNPKATIVRRSNDVSPYNEVANKVMEKYNVMVDDLYKLIMDVGLEKCIDSGGVHLTEYACALVGEHVANCILKVV